MITKHLTGDSEVLFFDSSAKARDYFIAETNPLLKVCLDEQLVEGEVYFPTTDIDAKGNVSMWRFNGGENVALDELIGGVNHCYQIGSAKVNDDVTHYVADFSEYVDESTISFWNKAKAIIQYNDLVDDEIESANERGFGIIRYDNTTWHEDNGIGEDKGRILFMEKIGLPYGECYFGWNEQPTNTIRCGDIKFTEVLKIVGCLETIDNWGRQERINAKETYELLNNPENWSDDQRFYCEGNGGYFIDELIGKVIKCNKKVFKVPNDNT